MYQKDYILRMIDMLGEMLRAIFGLMSKEKYKEAEQSIGEASLTMLRKDSAFFQQISEEKLTSTLIEEHHYTHGHLEILAELMLAEATLLYSKQQRPESLPYYKKSLLLFEFIENTQRTYSEERLDKIKMIKNRIVHH